MRSPMMTNGRPVPITTSLVAELTTVSATYASSGEGRTASPLPATSSPPLIPPARIVSFSTSSVHSRLERRGDRGHLCFEILVARAPVHRHLLRVIVRADQAGHHRRGVDALLEPLGQERSGARAPFAARHHLHRDVAPADHGQLGHGNALLSVRTPSRAWRARAPAPSRRPPRRRGSRRRRPRPCRTLRSAGRPPRARCISAAGPSPPARR